VPDEPKDIVLGPLFTVGTLAVLYGLVRRSPIVAAVGAVAIWADRRSSLGKKLTDKLRPPQP
jgi:hypothetical protein